MVGGYSLHLYCDGCDINSVGGAYEPVEFTAELGSTCRANARKAGWLLPKGKSQLVLCPKCKKNLKRHDDDSPA